MGKKILVMDDDPAIRILCADELSEEGYEVLASGDGSKVMNLIQQKRPDLIVMDIRLGRENGLDLLQDIRNAHPNLPVILFTAFPAFKYDLKSIAADYYVIKSSNLQELKFTIQKAINGESFSQYATREGQPHDRKPSVMVQN